MYVFNLSANALSARTAPLTAILSRSALLCRAGLYFVDGLTVRQIAEAEGVQHPSIVECLAAAKKKLLEYLKRMV